MKGKLVLAAALLVLPFTPLTAAEAEDSLDDEIQKVIEKYDLDESSFSTAYYNTVTGESYEWNGRAYMYSASVYKLPLNMYYYLQEQAGAISPHARIGGYDLAQAHYLSIVYSDNDASDALKEGLGNYRTYKNDMFLTFGDAYYQDLSNVPAIAYENVYYPADFLMDVLKYLNENRSSFEELLTYMSSKDQRNGFENTLRSECTVYQKQGWFGYVNTVAEMVDSDEPYLAVIMADDEKHGNSAAVCSEVNELLYAWNEQKAEEHREMKEKAVQEEEDQVSEAYDAAEESVIHVNMEQAETGDDGRTVQLVLFLVMAASIPAAGILTVIKQ